MGGKIIAAASAGITLLALQFVLFGALFDMATSLALFGIGFAVGRFGR
jgi:hypothetical protein